MARLFMVAFFVVASFAPSVANAITKRALLIGIDNYKNLPFYSPERGETFKNLKGSVNDVQLMKQLLTSHYEFREEDLRILLNEQASRDRILQSIDNWLIKATAPGDFVFLYFSGHGTQVPSHHGDPDGVDEALCPFDLIPIGASNTVDARLILDKEVKSVLHKLAGREVVVFMDCCHSGGMTRSIKGRTVSLLEATPGIQTKFIPVQLAPANDRSFSRGLPMKDDIPLGQVYLFASKKHQQSLEMRFADGFHGAMTEAVVEGLRKRKMSYRELHGYATRVIKDRFRIEQDPQLEPSEGEIITRPAFIPTSSVSSDTGKQPPSQPPAKPAEPLKPMEPTVEVASPQPPPEIIGKKVRVRVEPLKGSSSAATQELRQSLSGLPYVDIVEDDLFDRMIRGEWQDGFYHVRLLNRVGDVTPISPVRSTEALKQALAPHLEYAYIVKHLAYITNPHPPFKVRISIAGDRRDFKLGEKIIYQVDSEKDCYLLMLNLDPQGNFQVIFPNQFYQNNFIKAGALEIPDAKMRKNDFEFQFFPPTGEETVKLIATNTKINLEGLGLAKFQETFQQVPGRALAPTSPSRGLAKEIVSLLEEQSKKGGFQWSEDTVVVRSHE
jgi:hypothetical protein